MVFLVDQQTKGRGQGEKKWENSDLMLSFLWENPLKELDSSSCEDFAIDVLQALKLTWPGLKLQLKAPNDIYLKQKKVAGLLLEILNQGPKTALVAGLGLNVFSCPKDIESACLTDSIESIYFHEWESFLDKMVSFWSGRAVPINNS